MTLIGIAAYNAQPEIFKDLLKRGANINAIDQVCYEVIDVWVNCITALVGYVSGQFYWPRWPTNLNMT